MSTSAVQIERRAGQRFTFLLPVSFRDTSSGVEGVGFTQDVSSRGVLFLTDTQLQAGARIELTLNMPAEITLGDSMRVRCQGQILRVEKSGLGVSTEPASESKTAVAVRLEKYEYLSDSLQDSPRVTALHPQTQGAPALAQSAGRGELS